MASVSTFVSRRLLTSSLTVVRRIILPHGEPQSSFSAVLHGSHKRSFRSFCTSPVKNADLGAPKAHILTPIIYEGTFLAKNCQGRLADDDLAYVDLLESEEKGSDVNLVLHFLNGAHKDACDGALVMSNDSALAKALRMVSQEPGNRPATAKPRAVSAAVYARRVAGIGLHQLPDPIPGTRFRRPECWCGRHPLTAVSTSAPGA